jgi:hypothetical protein
MSVKATTFLAAVLFSGVFASLSFAESVEYTSIHAAVRSADLVLTGEIVAVGSAKDSSLGNTQIEIQIDRVLKGTFEQKRISAGIHRDQFSSDSDEHTKPATRAAFIVNKQGDGWRIAVTNPNIILPANVPLLQMMIDGVKDERVLFLYTGITQQADAMVVEYARDMGISGDKSIDIALHTLRHPWVNCRRAAAEWIPKMTPTKPQVQRLLPGLMHAMGDLLGQTTGDRNSYSRAAAYHAARHLMTSHGMTTENSLAEFNSQDLYHNSDKRRQAEQAIDTLQAVWLNIVKNGPR